MPSGWTNINGKLVTSGSLVRNRFRGGKPPLRRKYSYDNRFFQYINTEEKAYWLGFLMADGCVYKYKRNNTLILALHKKDRKHLVKFNESLRSTYPIYKHMTGLQVRINGQSICDDLIKQGCTQRKSLTLKFPKIKKNLVRHFIRGYFDGDGSIYRRVNKYKKYHISIVGTEAFIIKIRDILKLNRLKVHKEKTKGAYLYKLHICDQNDVKNICNYFYIGSNIYLDRKYNKAKRIMS